MLKWIPVATTVTVTILTAIFSPAFIAAHPTAFALLNAAAQVLHSVLPSTVPALFTSAGK
jgi:hypothetical protein